MLEKHLWRDFISVTASVAVLGIGVGGTVPLTALVLNARGFGPQVVGWMVAISAVGGVFGTLASPAASLKFGRRTVMMACVAIAAASVAALQYADGLLAWGALRALFGASMAPLFVLGEAWINTLPGDAVRGRVVAIYSTCFSLCQVAGPVLTDFLAALPDRGFLICGGVFLLGLPGIALAHDARSAHAAPSEAAAPKDSSASWLDISRLAPAILAGAALFAAFDTIILSFLPLFALERGATQGHALAAVVIVFAGDTSLQIAAGWLADRFGRARIHLASGLGMCLLLPLLPWMIAIPVVWEVYLFVLGGIAGSIYTLSMVSSGERFSGGALVRASGLIALTWNLASSVGPAATGIIMQHAGSGAMTVVLWLLAIGFVVATRVERRAAA